MYRGWQGSNILDILGEKVLLSRWRMQKGDFWHDGNREKEHNEKINRQILIYNMLNMLQNVVNSVRKTTLVNFARQNDIRMIIGSFCKIVQIHNMCLQINVHNWLICRLHVNFQGCNKKHCFFFQYLLNPCLICQVYFWHALIQVMSLVSCASRLWDDLSFLAALECFCLKNAQSLEWSSKFQDDLGLLMVYDIYIKQVYRCI